MHTLTFHLQKGGIGKTTLSVTAAWELSKMGYQTLLIDCDAQGNASSWLLEGVYQPEYELADVLTGRTDAESAILELTDNFSILSTFGMTHRLTDYGKSGIANEPFAIANMTDDLQDRFDFCILDLGPGLGNIETAALIAANEAVLTMTPEYFSLDGISTWTEQVNRLKKNFRTELDHGRLVVNGLNNSVKQMREVYESAAAADYDLYTIVTEPAFRKAQSAHLPAQELPKADAMKPGNAREVRRLAEGIAHGIGER